MLTFPVQVSPASIVKFHRIFQPGARCVWQLNPYAEFKQYNVNKCINRTKLHKPGEDKDEMEAKAEEKQSNHPPPPNYGIIPTFIFLSHAFYASPPHPQYTTETLH